MKKFKKGLLTAALTGALAAAMVMPAFAGETGEAELTDSSTKIQITKELDIGQGITVPNETFTFTYSKGTDKSEYTGLAEYVSDTSKYPDIASQEVTFSATDRAQNGTAPTTGQVEASDESLVKMAPAFDASSLNDDWDRAGLYVYEVKETARNTEGMTYDNKTYYLKIYVRNNGDDLEVASVGVTDDSGKKNAEPTNPDNPGHDNEATNDGNDFRFVNTYTKQVNKHEDPDNPNNPPVDGAFVLKKTVNGDYADKTKCFKFELTANLPSTAAATTPVTINARATDGADNLTDITFNNGTATIYLHDGDTATINTLPAGTVITVKEVDLADTYYTPSFTGKHDVDTNANGKSKVIPVTNGTQNTDLATGNVVVGSNGASVAYTNTFQNVTPTGIVINNFPYILLILVAIAGIAFYETKKRARA